MWSCCCRGVVEDGRWLGLAGGGRGDVVAGRGRGPGGPRPLLEVPVVDDREGGLGEGGLGELLRESVRIASIVTAKNVDHRK